MFMLFTRTNHSTNQQQTDNIKIIMENGDNKAYSQSNDLDTTEPLDNGHHDGPELRVHTNNSSNCNNSDNYNNPASTYVIVSSGITTPIHSAYVTTGESLQTNMQVPVLTNQSTYTSMQAPKPQSLTQVQIQQVIENSGVMQPQLQKSQPVINGINQNSTIQPQCIQHTSPVNQHATQEIPQQYHLRSPLHQHNMPEKFQNSFVPQNQSVLHNCSPIRQSVNQMINQQVPHYYNAPLIQSQHVTSESSIAVSMSNQQQFQSIPIQNHVQLQQNQQQSSPPSPQQQKHTPQQMRKVGQQLQGSQIQHNFQQTHHNTELTQMTNQQQQIPQSNQIENQMQQIGQQMQRTQNQPMSQQQQIGQRIQQNNQRIFHVEQIIPQKLPYEGQQLNQQNQQTQQQQQFQKIQQQMTQTSHPSQPTSQQILQPNQYMPQQNQVLTEQLEINRSNSKTFIPQSQNQQINLPQQSQDMQQAGQQYQKMMQSQPQQLPMQNNQPIMYQPIFSQDQSLNAMQIQQVVMQIPTHNVTSTQMQIQQPQPGVYSNMMQQPTHFVMPQNNIEPAISKYQQQMTNSMQQHAPITQNCVNSLINSMENCNIPSQQQIAPYKPSNHQIVETVDQKKENNNTEDVDNSSVTTLSIDIKIEQALDLVKSHLMYAVCEEVEILKGKIAELMNKIELLEIENSNLKKLIPPDMLE